MRKTNRELYEDVAEVFTNNGICSSDFAKLTELYRRTEMTGMVPIDDVIEVISRYLLTPDIIHGADDMMEELRKKYGVRGE